MKALKSKQLKVCYKYFVKEHTAKIELTGGEVKTSPETAAVNIPWPTNPP
jgi:hypothetical protein